MKVLLFNGSPHKEGATYTALAEIAKQLEQDGIEAQILQIGSTPFAGCMACRGCKGKGKCIFGDKDGLNEILEACKAADGFVFGSPVYYASANGTLVSFLDRLFYAGGAALTHKPAAAVACARRGGTTATLDVINKYFTINQMPVISSTYWNIVHSNRGAEEVTQDLEGMQTMRNIGKNMAWILKCIEAGKQVGIGLPTADSGNMTNFIR
ncbi:MAG: flavodoxin family protein [Oscillospiraceae bacterium]|nr:flavodoxin family protein [Oscillospiraceae bacterium]